jgi:5'(3')-deoxyribonucleotidase
VSTIPTKATILIDVDGVVAEFLEAVFDAVGTNKDPEELKQWNFFSMLSKDEGKVAEKVLEDPAFWATLPIKDHAQDAVKFLKNVGHKIVWVTSPWESCFGWDVARRRWIREHFGDDDIVITKSKEHVKGDVLIDDKPANVEAWQKAHPQGRALLFRAHYNDNYRGDVRRFSWGDVYTLF